MEINFSVGVEEKMEDNSTQYSNSVKISAKINVEWIS
jgi:hypothetical protein